MATEKPLVSVYMPSDVLERLREYQEEHGIKSASSAVVAVLEQFFNMGASAYAPIGRLEALEKKLLA